MMDLHSEQMLVPQSEQMKVPQSEQMKISKNRTRTTERMEVPKIETESARTTEMLLESSIRLRALFAGSQTYFDISG
jgi:hypothetical protein